MDLTSDREFRAAVGPDHILKVWNLRGATFTAVHGTVMPDGSVRTDSVEAVPQRGNPPICKATYAGDGYANVDMDCGAQRWNGTKSLQFLRKGLVKAGFTADTVNQLLAEMKRSGPVDYVGREW